MSDGDKKTTVLIVLDGWGHREETRDNAIAQADTPVWDRLWRQAPHTLISGSGLDVGLPAGQTLAMHGALVLFGLIVFLFATRLDRLAANEPVEDS